MNGRRWPVAILAVLLASCVLPMTGCGANRTEPAVDPAPQEEPVIPADPVEEAVDETEEDDVKKDDLGATVRVAIRLASPSVTKAGYRLAEIAQNPEAQAYRAKLEEEQREIVRQIEELTGHPLEVVWSFTLTTNVISANAYADDLDLIRTVDGVVSVDIEQRNEPTGSATAGLNQPNQGVTG